MSKDVTSNLYFDKLSTNGFLCYSKAPFPFVLSLSKDETSDLSFTPQIGEKNILQKKRKKYDVGNNRTRFFRKMSK